MTKTVLVSSCLRGRPASENRPNSIKHFRDLIRTDGFIKEPNVIESAAGDYYIVADGNNRLTAYALEGINEIEVIVIGKQETVGVLGKHYGDFITNL